MRRFKLILQYNGSGYSGWQRQQSGKTVQGELESALFKITGESITSFGASRTDKGVHALGQTVHFDDKGRFPTEQYLRALNAVLPEDIGVVSVEEVSATFHARFDAKKKWYRYFIYNSAKKPVFLRDMATHESFPLNFPAMTEAAKHLIGTHDFTSFKTLSDENLNQDPVRTLMRLDLSRSGDWIWFDLEGDGFLYKMVRGVIGTLAEVGRGRQNAGWVREVLAARDRQKAGPNFPGTGLYLMQVFYSEEEKHSEGLLKGLPEVIFPVLAGK